MDKRNESEELNALIGKRVRIYFKGSSRVGHTGILQTTEYLKSRGEEIISNKPYALVMPGCSIHFYKSSVKEVKC